MGQMKEMVMDMEERILDVIYEQAEQSECKNFAEFEKIVMDAYLAEPLLCHTYVEDIKEVASQMWFDELGNHL